MAILHLSGTASVLRDEKGEITAAIECIRDNTERKKLEEHLNRAEKMESLGTLAGVRTSRRGRWDRRAR